MIKLNTGLLVTTILVLCLAGCRKDEAQSDASLPTDGPAPSDGVQSTDGNPLLTDGGQPVTSFKVAAVQYTEGQASLVKASCTSDPMPDVCAVQEMIKQARAKGAYFAVTPEYGLGQKTYELSPPVGDNPGTSSAWAAGTMIKSFSLLAKQLDMYVTIDLLTYAGQDPNKKYYNTAVSFDPTGKVVDVHYKFNLYANEGTKLTEGTEVTVFNTPLGNVGVVICSDIQGSADEALRQKLANTLKAHVVLLPAMWGPNPGIPFFKSFASKYSFHVAAANTTTPTGNGGGIFSPTGAILDQTTSTSPAFVIAEIPVPGAKPPPSSSKVVITEFMADPEAVPDAVGEWIELYNAGTTAVDLKGWALGDTSSSHTISQSVTLASGQYRVLALNTTTATNGGVPAAYAYVGLSLNNAGDTILLYDAQGALVDEVKYLASWGVTSGAGLSLKQPALDNNVASSWCLETASWSGSAGDKGSPGAAAGCQ